MKKHLPNFITLLNLLTGCIAIALAFYDLEITAYLILLAAVFDFLDGFLARALKATSLIGRELDSLADIISFGLAPAFVIYMLFLKSWNLPEWHVNLVYLLPFVSFLVPVFSAIRLARFNISPDEHKIFRGLPTPANAILITSTVLIIEQFGLTSPIALFIMNWFTLLGLVLLSSFLLMAPVRLHSLKLDGYSWEQNKLSWILLLVSVLLLAIFYFAAIPMIIAYYILISLISIPQKRPSETSQ